MRHSELNPDYVKYSNDKNKKKLSIKHLKDRLDNMDKWIAQDRKWQAAREKRLQEDLLKRHELWLKIQEMQK